MKNKKSKKSKERTKARVNKLIQLKQVREKFIKKIVADYKKQEEERQVQEQADKIEALRNKILEEGVLTNVNSNYEQ
jgi:TPP-dependent pyruvate/acetoin dehydrogenase alpha subunit